VDRFFLKIAGEDNIQKIGR